MITTYKVIDKLYNNMIPGIFIITGYFDFDYETKLVKSISRRNVNYQEHDIEVKTGNLNYPFDLTLSDFIQKIKKHEYLHNVKIDKINNILVKKSTSKKTNFSYIKPDLCYNNFRFLISLIKPVCITFENIYNKNLIYNLQLPRLALLCMMGDGYKNYKFCVKYRYHQIVEYRVNHDTKTDSKFYNLVMFQNKK